MKNRTNQTKLANHNKSYIGIIKIKANVIDKGPVDQMRRRINDAT